MRFPFRFALIAALLSLTACGVESTVTDEGDELDTTDSALVTELPDRSCGVVLRDLRRKSDSTGTIDQTCTSTGVCYQAWTGLVDVDSKLIAAGGKVGAAYTVGGKSTVRRVTASLVGDSPEPGMKRYKFRIYRDIWPTTLTFDQQQAVLFRLNAYVTFPDSTRKMDRNRVVGLFDKVIVDASSGWTVSDDATVCHPAAAPRATLRFNGGWTQEQHGALVQGGKLVVDYDLYRLPQCMGSTYNGLPTWSTSAYVLFHPSNQLAQAPVVGRTSNNSQGPALAEFDIPKDATSAELWFYSSGRTCTSAYDSNMGSNYRFPVQSAKSQNVIWAGDVGGSFSRACSHEDTIADPVTLNSYNRERSCMFLDAEAWAPGVTDHATQTGGEVAAQVQYSIDGNIPVTAWLQYVTRDGNNFRYQWDVPRGTLTNVPWQKVEYRFRFSTDGVNWTYVGGTGDFPRTIQHDATW